ncbi:Lipoprotein [Rouxiella silvae]
MMLCPNVFVRELAAGLAGEESKTIVCDPRKVRVYYFPVLVLPSSLNLTSQVQHDN